MQKIPNLPSGWNVIEFWECPCQRDRDAVLLCETQDPSPYRTRYAVWTANLDPEIGGCFWGRYTDDLDVAREAFREKKQRLQ